MKPMKRVLFGLFVSVALQFPPVLAFHEPGHIPPTGTCREPACMEPQKDNKKKGKDKEPSKESKKKCDESLWAEYERKKKTAEELFEAAAKQREEVREEAEEFYKEQLIGMGEVSAVKGPPVYVAEKLRQNGLKAMAKTKTGLADKAAKLSTSRLSGTAVVTAEYAGIVGTALWVYTLAEETRQLNAAWEENQKMAAEAARLLDEATAAFFAHADQMKDCAEARKKLQAAEDLNGKARALMETWENNGNLYKDPSGDILDSSAAFKRAKEILSQTSSYHDQPFPPLRLVSQAVAAETAPTEATLEQMLAALTAVTEGMTLYGGGMKHVVQMHRAQEKIDRKLQSFLKTS